MRNTTLITLTAILATFSIIPAALAQNSSGNSGQQDSKDSPAAADKKLAKKEMEKLATVGMRIGLKTMDESGQLYPFALLQEEDGEIQSMGRRKGSTPKPPEEWASDLVHMLRKKVKSGTFSSAAMVKMHEVKGEDGTKTPGVWILADHRNHNPTIIFLPLVKKGKEESRKPGQMVFYGTEQWLFNPVEENSKPSSDG